MTRDDALLYLESFDPETDELPDWVAEAIDDDDAVREAFDARFTPWDASDLAQPAPPARRQRPAWVSWTMRMAALFPLLVCLPVGGGTLFLTTNYQADIDMASSAEPRAASPGYMSTPSPSARPAPAPQMSAGEREALEMLGYVSTTADAEKSGALSHRPMGDDLLGGPAVPMTGRFEERLAPDANTGEGERPGRERFTDYGRNDFESTSEDPLSTFSIDVDTASYTFARRRIREGYLPPTTSVRPEEFVNYLPYDYAPPRELDGPFTVNLDGAPSPFDTRTLLLRVGVQGKRLALDRQPPVHLTFLVDTSGSMHSADKLGLVKYAMGELVKELSDGDTVAIVAYAGSAGVVLPPTSATQQHTVLRALEGLRAGGSTAMGAGIDAAYRLASQAYQQGAVNRVVILSDGDANVGATSHQALSSLIRDHAKRGITLTTAGFGTGNYNDTVMERLANDGDGNYFYIDDQRQARRVFVEQLTSTLMVIAKDVKIQVELDPDVVEAYRLVGYENRDIADRDFRNDAVDAGEIGSGHRVTALYEVVLRRGAAGDLGTVRIRNKAPGPDSPAVERSYPLPAQALVPSFTQADPGFRMAVVAGWFAQILGDNPHTSSVSLDRLHAFAQGAARAEYPEDAELVDLIGRARDLQR
ncbi:MAG: von Willebrand factor type A domain-containing protein [Myxococcales bacterium]|nr:von Willebrand factor type A domain-containing protein [Myxococcales bacterium]